jgi:hypothetical protein
VTLWNAGELRQAILLARQDSVEDASSPSTVDSSSQGALVEDHANV